jgi:hypothetical protein
VYAGTHEAALSLVVVHSVAGQIDDVRIPKPTRLRGRLGLCRNMDGGVLLPNGDVVLCCFDYGMKHILGSLLEADLLTILRGRELARVLAGLENEEDDILCRRCEDAVPLAQSNPKTLRRLEVALGEGGDLVRRLPKATAE